MENKDLFKLFFKIKKEQSIEIIDTHVHPLDVLGVHAPVSPQIAQIKKDPSLLERLEYSRMALYALKGLFYLAPNYIKNTIKKDFIGFNQKNLLHEMNEAGVDKAVLVPIEPFARFPDIARPYNSKKFILVGSINPHTVNYEDIELYINDQIKTFGIKGLKLHPNIQNFFPRPSKNSLEIGEKLKKIYQIAEKCKLYLLFHGGTSYLFHQDKIKNTHALLKNFCDENGRSEIFDLNIPIIIAHGGHYNIYKINFSLLHKISSRYKNIFFDTAGLNPYTLAKIIENTGEERIVFGSDANYFKMKFQVGLVLKSLKLVKTASSFDEKVIKIFSSNYQKNILNFR